MRNAFIAGLLTATLIPLSLDQHPTTAPQMQRAALAPSELQVHGAIRTALFTRERNAEIERATRRSEMARERDFIAARRPLFRQFLRILKLLRKYADVKSV